MKQRLSALALLISFPADALLLQQGDVQFELDPATLHIAAGPVPINLAQLCAAGNGSYRNATTRQLAMAATRNQRQRPSGRRRSAPELQQRIGRKP
ncbi:hypothetical protein ABFY53_00970 [Serratia nematodiphila]